MLRFAAEVDVGNAAAGGVAADAVPAGTAVGARPGGEYAGVLLLEGGLEGEQGLAIGRRAGSYGGDGENHAEEAEEVVAEAQTSHLGAAGEREEKEKKGGGELGKEQGFVPHETAARAVCGSPPRLYSRH